jgi:acyl CoA:acetate/3-ketoacid CoA transferase beta subunit
MTEDIRSANQALAEAIKFMILNNENINWGEDIPYLVADILHEDGHALWQKSGRSIT